MKNLRSLFNVEVAHSSVIGEEIAAPEQLSCKVNETRVLKEAIIGQLLRSNILFLRRHE